jgi:hypothetical protein
MKTHRQNYASIKNKRSHQALTGLSREAFTELCSYFAPAWRAFIFFQTLDGKPRQRKATSKKSDILPTAEDKLFFILKFCKNNPLQEELAHDFAMPQSHANTWIRVLLPILAGVLVRMRQAPEREVKHLSEILEAYEYTVMDVTERLRERPAHEETQKSAYSGKKKLIAKRILS